MYNLYDAMPAWDAGWDADGFNLGTTRLPGYLEKRAKGTTDSHFKYDNSYESKYSLLWVTLSKNSMRALPRRRRT